jgi:carbon-monoxide dehydrogenase large subunit
MSGVIGQRVLRREDSRFLQGKGTYVENLPLAGARHVTFVRSPFAHARVSGIDASAALALPGTEVFTAADVDMATFDAPPLPGLERRMGRPFLARDVVRFVGDIVALVVTESRTAGPDAAELVAVDYDPLPAVVDPREALADRTLLFPEVGTNVCLRRTVEEPDASLFDGCDVVVSGRLVSQRLAPCPLEPRSTAAEVDAGGRLTVWLSTQTPHHDRHGLA